MSILSLIVSLHVGDCIVMAADTCRTTKSDGAIVGLHKETVKIVSVCGVVVSFCGNSDYKGKYIDALVKDALATLKCVRDAPLMLLNYFALHCPGLDTIFHVCYYYDDVSYMYRCFTKNNSVGLLQAANAFGGGYNGLTDVAHAMLGEDIDYEHLNVRECVELVKSVFSATMCVYSYRRKNLQGVSGFCDIFVLFPDGAICSRRFVPMSWLVDIGAIIEFVEQQVTNNSGNKEEQSNGNQ